MARRTRRTHSLITPARLRAGGVLLLAGALGAALGLTVVGGRRADSDLRRSQPVASRPVEKASQLRSRSTAARNPKGWERHASAFDDQGGPLMAVVIDDVGLDQEAARALIAIDAPLTLAFLPYAPQSPMLAKAAHDANRDVVVHMPMEPLGDEDPGPNALRVGLDGESVRRRVSDGLATFPRAVGLNNHMGSRFTADQDGMASVMQAIKPVDLIFLDSLTTSQSRGYDEAKRAGLTALRRDVFLDNQRDVEAILAQLDAAEDLARRRGHAIAIGHPHPETLEAIRGYLARDERVALAPISAIAARLRNADNPSPERSAAR